MTDKFEASAELKGAASFVSDAEKVDKALSKMGDGADSSKVDKLGDALTKVGKDADKAGGDAEKAGKDFDKLGSDMSKAGADGAKAADGISKAGDAAEKGGDAAESGGSKWQKFALGGAAMAGGFGLVTAAAPMVIGAMSNIVGGASAVNAAQGDMQAALGVSAERAEQLGDVVKDVYGNNFGADIADVGATITQAFQEMGDVGDEELKSIAENALRMRDAFGTETTASMQAVDTLMKDFGLTSTEAFDLVTYGMQNGLNTSGDFLESITEYGPQFRDGGATADEFFSVLESGMANGVLGTDKAADAFKEFRVRIQDGSKLTGESLTALGIDADALLAGMSDGTISAADAFQTVLDGIKNTDDETLKMQAGVGLLGTQYEDLGQAGIDALTMTGQATKDAAGATAGLDAQYNTLGDRIAGTWRKAQVGIMPLQEMINDGLLVAFDALADGVDSIIDVALAAKPTVEALVKQGIDPLIEGAKGAADALQPMLDVASDLFEKLNPGPALIAGLATAIGVLLVPMIAQGVTAVLGLARSFVTLTVAMATNPLVLLALAAAALVAGIILVVQHWDELVARFPVLGDIVNAIQAKWAELLPQIQETLVAIREYITEVANNIRDKFQEIWPSIMEGAKAAGAMIVSAFQAAWPYIQEGAQKAIEILKGLWEGIKAGAEQARGIFESVWPAIVSVVESAIAKIKSVATAVWPDIQAIISQAMATIGSVIELGMAIVGKAIDIGMATVRTAMAVWPYVQQIIQTTISTITSIVASMIPGLVNYFQAAWNTIEGVTRGVWTALSGIIQGALQIIQGIVQVFTGVIKGDFSQVWDGIKNIVSGAWTAIQATISGGITAVTAIIKGGWDAAKAVVEMAWAAMTTAVGIGIDAIAALGGKMISAGESLMNDMWEGLKGIWDSVKGWVGDLPGLAADAITAGASLLLNAGKEVLEALWNGIKEVWDREVHFWTNLPSTILNAVGDLGGVLKNAGTAVIQGFIDGVQSKFEDVKSKLGELTDMLPDWKGPASKDKDILKPAGQMVIQGFIDGTEEKWGYAKGTFERFTGDIVMSFDNMAEGVAWNMDGISDALTEFGYAPETVIKNYQYLEEIITEAFASVEDGSLSMQQAVTNAMWEMDDVLQGTQLTAEEWAEEFQRFPKAAAGAFNELNDRVRYDLGETILAMNGFGEAAAHMAEDFSFYTDDIVVASGKMAVAGSSMMDEFIEGMEFMVPTVRDVLMGLTDEIYTTTASGLDIAANKLGDWPDVLATVFVHGIEEVNPQITGAIMNAVKDMDDTWAAAMQGFGRDAGSDLIMWQNVLVEGIRTGKSLTESELEAMMLMIADQMAIFRGDMPLESALAMDEMFVAMVQSMQEGGGVANAEMIQLLNILLGHIQEFYPEMIGTTKEGFSEWGEVIVSETGEITTALEDALNQIVADLGEGAKAIFDEIGAEINVGGAEIMNRVNASLGSILAAMLEKMKYGRRMSTDEIQGMFADILSAILAAPLEPEAEAKALALLNKFVEVFMANGGRVTHSVQDILEDIMAIIADPANVDEAAAAGTNIAGAITGGLLDSPEGIKRLGNLLSTLLADQIKAAGPDAVAQADAIAGMIAGEFVDSLRESGATGDLSGVEATLTRIISDAIKEMAITGTLEGDAAGDAIIAAIIAALLGGAPAVAGAANTVVSGITPAPAYATGTVVGNAVGAGIMSAVGGWGQNYAGWINVYTNGIPAATKGANEAAGKAVGGGIGTAAIGEVHKVFTPGAAMSEILVDATPEAVAAATELGDSVGQAITQSADAQMKTMTDAWVDDWSLFDDNMRLYLTDMGKVLNTIGAKMSQLGAIALDGEIWDALLGQIRPKVLSDDFLFRGVTGNSPESNIGEILGLPPGHNIVGGMIGEEGYRAGSRGGQHSGNGVIISGAVNSLTSNGYKWDGRQIVKMDLQESAQRWISGWNSPLDPSMLLKDLEQGILGDKNGGGMIEGGIDLKEVQDLLKGQTVKALSLFGDQDVQKEANKYMQLMHLIAKKQYEQAKDFAAENLRGDKAGRITGVIQGLIDAAVPEPENPNLPGDPDIPFPGFPEFPENDPIDPYKPVKELPDILADGLIDMADVLRTRTAGFPDLANSLVDVIAGVADMADVLTARHLGLDALALQMERILAGLPIQIDLPDGLEGASAGDYSEDTYSRAAASLSGPGYASMPYDAASAGGAVIPVDLSNGVWGSSPRANAAMVEKAVDRAFERQRDGLLNAGLRG